jgi:hypothetical protein
MLVFRRISRRRKFTMKKKRYSTEQIVAALKQAEMGLPVADLIRQNQACAMGARSNLPLDFNVKAGPPIPSASHGGESLGQPPEHLGGADHEDLLHRPHSAICYEAPATSMMSSGPGSPPRATQPGFWRVKWFRNKIKFINENFSRSSGSFLRKQIKPTTKVNFIQGRAYTFTRKKNPPFGALAPRLLHPVRENHMGLLCYEGPRIWFRSI